MTSGNDINYTVTCVTPRPTVFDIETGPLPDADLRAMFVEKTFDEFAASCDKRWKQDTVEEKYADYRVDAFAKFANNAAKHPTTGYVAAIGYGDGLTDPDVSMQYIGDDRDEADVLTDFWCTWSESRGGEFIGHNILDFDLPFMVRRSWINGIQIPRDVYTHNCGRTYWSDRFVDTMLVWQLGRYKDFIGLGKLSELLGGPSKPDDCSGAEFASMLLSGDDDQKNAALGYLDNDIQMTAFVARRLRGE